MYNKIKFFAFSAVLLCLINLSPLLGQDSPKPDQSNSQQQQDTQKDQQNEFHFLEENLRLQQQMPQNLHDEATTKQNDVTSKGTQPKTAQPRVTEQHATALQNKTPEKTLPGQAEKRVTKVAPSSSKETVTMPPMDLKMKQALQTSEGETVIAIKKDKVAPFLQHIKDRGKLIVAMYSVDQPPFFMKDKNGKLIGLDVEIATKMAEIMGVEVEFNREAQSFNEVVDIVSSGKADIGISKLSFTLVRSQKVLYTKPYIVLGKTFLLNRLEMAKLNTSRKADTLNGLLNKKGRTIGVIKDSSYESFARQLFPNATIVPLDSWGPQTLEMGVRGDVLGIFRDDLEIKKLIRQKPDANLKVLPVTLKNQEDPIRIIVPWNQDHFVFWVNEFLQSLEISFTVDELLTKYNSYFQQLEDDRVQSEKEAKDKSANDAAEQKKALTPPLKPEDVPLSKTSEKK